MKIKAITLACMMMFVGLTSSALAQQKAADPLSGTWAGDWGPSASDRNTVTVELKWDGKALSGNVNPGPTATALQKCTYDAKTGAVHMEADSKNRKGDAIHFVIDGKLEGSTMSGSWNHDTRKGDFKITRK